MTESHRREPIEQDASREPAISDRSLESRCRQLTASLRDALGPDGCSALIGRALAECEPGHPVLKHMRGPDGREIQLDHVSAAVERYGLDKAEAGVNAMVASLGAILAKLIGEDMTQRLLDLDAGESSQNQEAP
jgi:hypothetical protein